MRMTRVSRHPAAPAVAVSGASLGPALQTGLKPLHLLHLGSMKFTLYVGLLALVANVAVAVAVNLALPARRHVPEALEAGA